MTSKLWHIRLYTGPTSVQAYAEKLRTAGYNVTCEGTEHVHFEVFDLNDGWGAISAVALASEDIGIPFGASDWQPLPLRQQEVI